MSRPSPPLRLALLGWPARHSRSPTMHRAALRAMALPGDYEALEVPPERLGAAVERLRREGYAGFNVTAPHKRAVVPLLDALDPLAARIGAVNTVVRLQDGALRGFNTDAEATAGWLRAAGAPLRPDSLAVVLGTGGAARAVAAALAAEGLQVAVAGRRPAAAEALLDELGLPGGRALPLREPAALRAAFSEAAALVQASSATFGGGEEAERFAAALPWSALPPGAVVGDLVYAPRRTSVLEAARRHGLRTADGLDFLVRQGALALQRWTGRPVPLETMRRAAGEVESADPIAAPR